MLSSSSFENNHGNDGLVVIHGLTNKESNSLFGFENLNSPGTIRNKFIKVSTSSLWDLLTEIGENHGVQRKNFEYLMKGDYFALQVVEDNIPVPAELVQETHAACLSNLPDGDAKNNWVSKKIPEWLSLCAKYDEINRKQLISKSLVIEQALEAGQLEKQSNDVIMPKFNPNVGNQNGRNKPNTHFIGQSMKYDQPYFTNGMKFIYDEPNDAWKCVDRGNKHISIVSVGQMGEFIHIEDAEWDDVSYRWKRRAEWTSAGYDEEALDEATVLDTNVETQLLGNSGNGTDLDNGKLASIENFQAQLDKNKSMSSLMSSFFKESAYQVCC